MARVKSTVVATKSPSSRDNAAQVTVEQWGDVGLASLRLKCNQYDLEETGRKHVLQQRLYEHFHELSTTSTTPSPERETDAANDDTTLPYEEKFDLDAALNDEEDLLDYDESPPPEREQSPSTPPPPSLQGNGRKRRGIKKKTKLPATVLSRTRQPQPTAKKARSGEDRLHKQIRDLRARPEKHTIVSHHQQQHRQQQQQQHIHPHHRRSVSLCSTSQLSHNDDTIFGSTTAHGCQHPTRSPTVDTYQPTTTTTLLHRNINHYNPTPWDPYAYQTYNVSYYPTAPQAQCNPFTATSPSKVTEKIQEMKFVEFTDLLPNNVISEYDLLD